MTIPNSPEQKLIEALERHFRNYPCIETTDTLAIARSLLAELAELREKAACLQNELNEGRARQWRTIHFYLADEIAKGWKFGIRCECPICINVRNLLDPTILKQMIEQNERT